MIRRPPRSTRTDTLFPYTTLFRSGRAATGGVEGGGATPDFGSAISAALQQVNGQQAKASELSEAYERGDTHDIVSVMIERQKASPGFETTLQVRNKPPSAYRATMNRSEERRAGKECVSTGQTRWSPGN